MELNISIFGLGYVGCVSLGCLAKSGHKVVGIDINQTKINLINQGQPTIIEKDIDLIINEQFLKGNIKATTDFSLAIKETDLSIICVGTPSKKEGYLNLEYIYNTAKQIGSSLKEKDTFHYIAIRSTVLPGTNIKVGKIIEEQSGKKRNIDFSVVSNPEFLREGTAVADYYNPPFTIVGSDNENALNVFQNVYSEINGEFVSVEIEVAEIIKYVNNSYHALKISFANEVGNICKKLGIDAYKVMELFAKDKHLNISDYYFKPGFAYGGSCLPKDLKAFKSLAHDYYLKSPIVESISESNENQKKTAIDLIANTKKRNIGFIGISFKPGTDDLRYSPAIDVAEYFFGKGYNINIWDKNVHISKIIGSNRQFIDERIPHLSNLINDDINVIIEKSDVIFITQEHEILARMINMHRDKLFIDTVRIIDSKSHENYIGICW